MPIVPTPECAIQFQSEVNGLGNTDIVHFVGPSGQIVSWIDFDGIGQGGLTVSPASSILFQNVIGNINVSTQVNSGLNANPSTFFRGDGTWSQVQFTNIPGIASPSQIPNISGGIITSGLVATQFGGTGVNLSTSGSATGFLAQNSSHIISTRSIAATDIPALPASIITSGQLALTQGGTGVDLSASGGANLILAQDGSHVISARALTSADIPNLPASKVTSGILSLAQGGTGVDLSASGAAHNFLAQNASHVISAAQPAFSDISGTATSGQYVVMVGDSGSGGVQGAVPAPPAGSAAAGKFLKADGTYAVPASSGLTLETNTVLNGSQTLLNLHGGANVTLTDNGSGQITINSSSSGGTIALDTNNSANSSQAVLSLNNGTGIVTANPTSGNVTFTLQPASAGTIGGVNSLAAVASKWIDSISTLGVPHASQPAFTDISGTAATGQIPNLDASVITTGQIELANGGTDVDLSASGSSTAFLAQDASHLISARSIASTDVPALDASKITTGQIGLAQGGTGVDLSAAGGTSNFLAINASHVISAVQPALSDILGTGNLLPSVAGVPNIGSVSLPFGQIFANQFIVPSGSSAFLVGTEGNTPVSPQAGNDILYLGDINSHTAQVSNNGNSFQSIATWDTTSPTVHGVVVAGNFPAVHTSGPGTSGQVLTSNGAGSDPTFQTPPPSTLPALSSSTQGKTLSNNGASAAWSGTTLDCSQFSGTTDAEKIVGCLAALKTLNSNAGVADCRAMTGLTWDENPFAAAGTNMPNSGTLLLPGGIITLNYVPFVMPQYWRIEGINGIGNGGFGTTLQVSASTFPNSGTGKYSTGTVTVSSPGRLQTVTGVGTGWTNNTKSGAGNIAVGCAFVSPSTQPTSVNSTYGIITSVNSATSITLGYSANNGTGAPAGSNYIIYCPAVLMGDGSYSAGLPAYNVVGTHFTVDANNVAGVVPIMNLYAQQSSYLSDVKAKNYCGIGFDFEGPYIYDSGPYTDLIASPGTCGNASTINFVIRTEGGVTFGFTGLSSAEGGASPVPATGIDVGGTGAVIIDGIDSEGPTTAITTGALTSCVPACTAPPHYFGVPTQAVSISNVFHLNGSAAVHLSNAYANTPYMTLSNINGSGATNVLIDDNNSCTIPTATESRLVQYSLRSDSTIGISTSKVSGCYASEKVASLSTPSHLLISSTAPTITSHFNTSGDSILSNNGTASFRIQVGTGAGTTTGTIGLPTAANGWNCFATNQTNAALVVQTSSTASSSTLINLGKTFSVQNWTNSDVLLVSCFAY